MNLMEQIHADFEHVNGPEKSHPLPEAVIETLKEHYERYRKMLGGCLFKPGDIVTPRPGLNMTDVGHPHIVLETRDAPEPFFHENGNSRDGMRADMRVMACAGGRTYVSFWMQSYECESYMGAGL